MKGTITLQWQIRRKSKLNHVRGKAGVLKVKWKSYKGLCLGKRSLQNLAVNSGFYRPPTVPDSVSLPIPERQQGHLGWEAHGVGDTMGGNRTYSAHLYQGALLGLCWVSFQVNIEKKKNLKNIFKSTFWKEKWDLKLRSNLALNSVEKGWLRKRIQTSLCSKLIWIAVGLWSLFTDPKFSHGGTPEEKMIMTRGKSHLLPQEKDVLWHCLGARRTNTNAYIAFWILDSFWSWDKQQNFQLLHESRRSHKNFLCFLLCTKIPEVLLQNILLKK